jgi:BolA protein
MHSEKTTSTSSRGPVENAIREKVVLISFLHQPEHTDHHRIPQLTTLLQPTSITVTNDSWQHRHHAAMREPGAANGETRRSKRAIKPRNPLNVG